MMSQGVRRLERQQMQSLSLHHDPLFKGRCLVHVKAGQEIAAVQGDGLIQRGGGILSQAIASLNPGLR
jgi:urease accessory protein UreE